MVEKRWRAACRNSDERDSPDTVKYAALPHLPSDSMLAAAFVERKTRSADASSQKYLTYAISFCVCLFMFRYLFSFSV